jgi:hypothetical protein
MVRTITWTTKRGRQKKCQKTHSLQKPKKGRELVPLVVGSHLTHINQLNDAKIDLLSVPKK